MTTTKTFLFLSAAVALASAQCDPPESFHQVRTGREKRRDIKVDYEMAHPTTLDVNPC